MRDKRCVKTVRNDGRCGHNETEHLVTGVYLANLCVNTLVVELANWYKLNTASDNLLRLGADRPPDFDIQADVSISDFLCVCQPAILAQYTCDVRSRIFIIQSEQGR